MGEVLFDLQNGVVIPPFGTEEEPAQPTAGQGVVPLADILTAKDFPYANRNYDRLEAEDWGRDRCVTYGHWVMKLLASKAEPDKPPPRISSEHIDRLRILGVGPSRTRIKVLFGTMWAYGDAIGVHSRKSSERYRSWTTDNYVTYASRLASSLHRKPREPDFERRYRAKKGPSPYMILEHCGGIRKLNELIGYPNIHDWDEDDYTDWGTKVMAANPGYQLTARLVGVLSKAKRGPSYGSIKEHFGNLPNFQQQAEALHAYRTEMREQQDDILLSEYETLRQNTGLELSDNSNKSVILATTARYKLAEICLPGTPPDELGFLAANPVNELVRRIIDRSEYLNAGYIEMLATHIKVFDYIWPMDSWRKYLHVPPEKLGYRREGNKKRYVEVAH